jgi:hypothetical protein
MADRLLVPYKSSYLRILETLVVLAATFGLAAASQWLYPKLPVSYVVLAVLVLGYVIVPRLGDRWAIRHGAAMLSRAERRQRYLSELGPIGSSPTHSATLLMFAQDARLRRPGSRPRHGRRR